jgi:hypothetical protein
MFVQCKLNGKVVHGALIDSAAPTCITRDTLVSVLGTKEYQLAPAAVRLVQWEGKGLDVAGVVQLDFSIGGWHEARIPVFVVDRAPTGFIIGNDLYPRAGSFTIDAERHQVKFGQHFVHYSTTPRRPSEANHEEQRRQRAGITNEKIRSVHVLHRRQIPKYTATYLQVGMPPRQEGEGVHGELLQFTPDVTFEERHQLKLVEGVATSALCGVVWVQNHTENNIVLHPGDLLGTLQPLTEVRQPYAATREIWAAAIGSGQVSNPWDKAQEWLAGMLSTAVVGEKDRTDDSIAEPPGMQGVGPPKAVVEQIINISPDAPKEQFDIIKDLVNKYGLFCPPVGVGLSNAPPMEIKLKPGAVINNRHYGATIERQLEMMRLAEELAKGGVIHPSVSAFNSPVVLARKPDGSWRFCVDYRQVNAATERDAYQLPRTTDLLDQLGGSSIFSVLDLASAFWQIRLAEEAQQYTAFSLLSGHWEFNVVPMGLSNSPSWMQRALESALGDVLYRGALAYIDDIIVYGSTWAQHNERLEITVSTRARISASLAIARSSSSAISSAPMASDPGQATWTRFATAPSRRTTSSLSPPWRCSLTTVGFYTATLT